jgi:hypothetical protein
MGANQSAEPEYYLVVFCKELVTTGNRVDLAKKCFAYGKVVYEEGSYTANFKYEDGYDSGSIEEGGIKTFDDVLGIIESYGRFRKSACYVSLNEINQNPTCAVHIHDLSKRFKQNFEVTKEVLDQIKSVKDLKYLIAGIARPN